MNSNTRSVKVNLSIVLADVPASVTPEGIREHIESYVDGLSVWFPQAGGDGDDDDFSVSGHRGAYVTSATVTSVEDVTEADSVPADSEA